MHSASECARRRTNVWVGALTLVALALAPPARPDATAPANRPTPAQVAAAVAKLQADPNLGTKKQTRRLRWKSSDSPRTPPKQWAHWLLDAFASLASAARVLVWVGGILAVGLLGLFIKRYLQSRSERAVPLQFDMPTHVRDLDIRPETLPDDIGGSAFELWESGGHRAALALLYRGALSRLAHRYGVPIRDSSTEGDCLALAAAHLSAAPAAYAARLIRVWQRAVYGNIDPTLEELRSLCEGFSATLDTPPEATPAEQAA